MFLNDRSNGFRSNTGTLFTRVNAVVGIEILGIEQLVKPPAHIGDKHVVGPCGSGVIRQPACQQDNADGMGCQERWGEMPALICEDPARGPLCPQWNNFP